jgi:hypothetical protein
MKTAQQLMTAGAVLLVLALTGGAQAGLIAHYSFDEVDAGNTPCNLGVNHATLGDRVSIDTTAGVPKFGAGALRALGGDTTLGPGSGATTANQFAWANDARTITFWWKTATPGSVTLAGTFVSLGNHSASGYAFDMLEYWWDVPNNTTTLRVGISGAGLSTTPPINDGNWHFVAVTVPNNATFADIAWYVDGNATDLNTSVNTLAVATATDTLVFGDSHYAAAADRVPNGWLDEFRLYDEVLTQTQILALYNNYAPPVITSDGGGATADVVVSEGETAVTTVTASDANEPAQTLTYSISGGANAALFSIVPATGVLTFNDNAVAGVYEVIVQVENEVPLTDTQTITVTVTAGAVPTSENDAVTLDEDTPTALSTTDFGTYNANGGDPLAEVKITTLPDKGSLTLDGVAVEAEDVITVAQLDANLLVYTPVLNANGTAYTTIGFKVGNGTVFSVAYTLTVNVTPVNDAPTTANSSVTTLEDVAYTFAAANFPFSDVDAGDSRSAIKVVTLPAKGVLKLSGSPIAANAEILVADVPNLTFTPAWDENGDDYTTFTFQVADQAAAYSDAATMTIDVTAVADPTVMMAAGNVQASAPAGTVVGTVKARNPDGGALTYAKVTGRNSDRFAIDSGTGELTLTTPAGAVDEKYYVDVTASGATTDTLAIEVTVVAEPVTAGTFFLFR